MRNKLLLTLLTVIFLSSCNQVNNSGFSYKLIPVEQADNWGYIDNKGVTKIPFYYKMAYPFSEGLAMVTDGNGRVGYINEYGTDVIKPQYKSGTYFSEGKAFVIGDEGYPKCIDKKGNVLFDLKEATTVMAYTEGLAFVYTNGKIGYVNGEGKMVINPQFDFGSKFKGERAVVGNVEHGEMKYGFIDKQGKLVIPCQYSSAKDFNEGYATVVSDSKVHCIKEDGKDAFPLEGVDYIGSFSEGYAAAMNGDKLMYVDTKGKIQIEPGFEIGKPFNNGLAAVSKDGKWGYIDTKGKEAINRQFDAASKFYGDFAVVETNGKYGLINKAGQYTVEPKYKNVFCRNEMLSEDDPGDIVFSRYVIPEDVAQNLLGSDDKEEVMGMDGTQTLQDIMTKMQYHKVSIAGTNAIIDSTIAYIGPAANVTNTIYEFRTPVSDGHQILNVNPLIDRITYVMGIAQDGVRVADIIRTILINKFQAQAVRGDNANNPQYKYYHLQTRNTDYKLLYTDNTMVLYQSFLRS